jgi:predicted nucleic acid-binding protein
MTAMRFVDTNVLIYAISPGVEDAEKAQRALALLEERELALSVQVLQEFYVQVTRASRPNALIHREAVDFITSLLRFRVQEISVGIVQSALAIRERYGLSYWDSAIIAAAGACECDVVYSEDMSPAQSYGGVRVVNPFL